MPLDRAQRRRLGQPDRLLRHEHALRDDHQEPLLQQRARHRPERAGLGEVPAAGGQRDRRQRHLLEQLQLPRGQPPFQVAQTGDRRRSCRSAPASCCSAAAATASRTTASTATTSLGVAGDRRASCCQKNPQARRARRQHGHRTTVRARRHRPQRPRPHLRRQRQRQLLLGRADVARCSTDTRRPATCTGKNAFSQPTRRHDARLDRRECARTAGSSTRTPAKKGFKPLEVFKP